MSYHERRHMRLVDSLVLDSTGDTLHKLQRLDKRTQLDGESFYDICNRHMPKALLQARMNS